MVVEYAKEMQGRIDKVTPILKQHMQEVQGAQCQVYNQQAQPREFQPGNRVLLLVPSANCKFLAHWKGPFTIMEHVGPRQLPPATAG